MNAFNMILKNKIENELNIEESLIRRWFKPVNWELSGKELNIVCPNIFFKKQLLTEYWLTIKAALKNIYFEKQDIKIETINFIVKDFKNVSNSLIGIKENFRIKKEKILIKKEWANLNKKQTFDNLLLGSFNFLAYKSLKSIIETVINGENLKFKTLFLYSKKSWGKTHLINAFVNELISISAPITVLKLNANLLIDNFGANKNNSIQNTGYIDFFKAKIIIIDSIQDLKKNQFAQEQLINIYDSFLTRDRIFIFTGTSVPNSLNNIIEPLKSRLGSGLTINIGIPEHKILEDFLKINLEKLLLNLSEENYSKILLAYGADFRLLKGFLETLFFVESNLNENISLDEKINILLPANLTNSNKNINIEIILTEVAKAFNLKVSELQSHTKIKQFAWPRRVAMYLARELSSLTTVEIGKKLGNRDHSTVIHALKKINIELTNKNNVRIIEDIKTSILKQL